MLSTAVQPLTKLSQFLSHTLVIGMAVRPTFFLQFSLYRVSRSFWLLVSHLSWVSAKLDSLLRSIDHVRPLAVDSFLFLYITVLCLRTFFLTSQLSDLAGAWCLGWMSSVLLLCCFLLCWIANVILAGGITVASIQLWLWRMAPQLCRADVSWWYATNPCAEQRVEQKNP